MFNKEFKKYKKAFVLGTGGGNDIVSAIIPALHLQKYGIKTTVAGVLSPAAFHIFDGKEEQTINKVFNVERYVKTPNGNQDIDLVDNYLPRVLETMGHKMDFYDLSLKFGTEQLVIDFNEFLEKNGYDLVIACDVGGDILGTVEDSKLLSPMMDFTSLYLLRHLSIDNYLVEFGIGTDGELRVDGMDRILTELKDDIIEESSITYEDEEFKVFKEVFDNIKTIRQGHTNVMTIETLQTDEDIFSEYRFRTQVGKKKWFTPFQVILPAKYAGKVWVFDGKSVSEKRRLTSFPYDSPLEQMLKLKVLQPSWKTEMDMFYYDNKFVLTPAFQMPQDQREDIINYCLDTIESDIVMLEQDRHLVEGKGFEYTITFV